MPNSRPIFFGFWIKPVRLSGFHLSLRLHWWDFTYFLSLWHRSKKWGKFNVLRRGRNRADSDKKHCQCGLDIRGNLTNRDRNTNKILALGVLTLPCSIKIKKNTIKFWLGGAPNQTLTYEQHPLPLTQLDFLYMLNTLFPFIEPRGGSHGPATRCLFQMSTLHPIRQYSVTLTCFSKISLWTPCSISICKLCVYKCVKFPTHVQNHNRSLTVYENWQWSAAICTGFCSKVVAR